MTRYLYDLLGGKCAVAFQQHVELQGGRVVKQMHEDVHVMKVQMQQREEMVAAPRRPQQRSIV
jgi:hypothetical protein